MDAGRDIDQGDRRANRAERWFVWTETSLAAFFIAALVAILMFAAVFVVVDLVVAVLTA